jgi:protein-tyrosine phosphatase
MFVSLPLALFIAGSAAANTVTPGPRSEDTRSLALQGAPNFRDIGGYATTDGRHVRWDRVFRSNDLSKVTPSDAAKIAALNLAAVIDLRTQDERNQSPSVWLTPPPHDVYESSQQTLAPAMRTTFKEAKTAEGARAAMISFYSSMPDDYKAEYSAMFYRLAAGEVPLLVHCTAGKDRTGVAIALLLASIGVPRSAIDRDYSLTEQLLPTPAVITQGKVQGSAAAGPMAALADLPEKSRLILWRADPNYVEAALVSVDREYGSVDEYVVRGLGLSKTDLTAIRKALLQ